MTSGGKAIVAGAVGGLVGTWAMNYVQRWWSLAADGAAPYSPGGKHDARDWQERSEGRNANEMAAEAVGERVVSRPLTQGERRAGARLVHFAFGTAMGAIYGARRGRSRHPSIGHGVGFGLALWAAADELTLPLIGLSAPAEERPAEMHLQAVAAHIVYGGVAELGRSAVMSLWSDNPAR